jgi:glutamate N-acetyltransferase/amino-acid acetyltransferase
MAAALAKLLDCPADAVLTSSTGAVGVPLNRKLIAKALPRLVDSASENAKPFAEAIVTTDTCTKIAHISFTPPGHDTPVRLLGVAKGSGMIHPNMATILAYVCTDAAIAPSLLDSLLKAQIGDTFNAITVDGDTSTNDSVFVLASGATKVFIEAPAEVEAFATALHAVLHSLAIQVARDGEGATRLLTVEVTGARDVAAATTIARAICSSNLFKCSVFAGKAEWGRLAAIAGQAAHESGGSIDSTRLGIEAQGLALVVDGTPTDVKLADVERRLRGPEVTWKIDLGQGSARFSAYGCDLSYDYVRINADKALQVEASPEERVARNLSLGAYSPRLKQQLLVEGLSYFRRFTGMRAVVDVRGAAASRLDLVAGLAQDLELCLDAGMKVLAVVPSSEVADTIQSHMHATGHHVASVPRDPLVIHSYLDRGHLCVLIESSPDPGELVGLTIKLGTQKLVALADEQGVRDRSGLVSVLSPEVLLAGLERGRFQATDPEVLALARHAATQGGPALQIVDGRMPHALVGELFTDQGIGTLITRQVVA